MCEWSISNFAPEEGATVVDASATLGKFVNDELLHIQERPSGRSDSFVAVEVPEMRDSTLIGSRTKSAVRILRAQWTPEISGDWSDGCPGFRRAMPGCSSPPSSTSQSSCSTCSFWGVIPIRSHQKWWTFPCLGGWCRRPWSISQRRQVLGVIFPGWWCLATFRIFQAPELGDYQYQWLGSWLGISQQLREADRKHFFSSNFPISCCEKIVKTTLW